jgi:universal stress protein E
MTQLNNLFVVYDPTREEQPALDKAASIAEGTAVKLHVFVCIFSDTSKSEDPPAEVKRLIAQQQGLLDEVLVPLFARGIDVSTEVEWDKDWYQAVVRASAKCDADMVLKSSYKHSSPKRLLNRTSDWTLIRECLCPVLLVKGRKPREIPRVLAAIDITAKKKSYERLNQKVISVGKEIMEHHGAEVHVVNAFRDFKGMPDRQELIQNTGIDSERIHIKMGEPEKVIVSQAKNLNVSLVVVGNSARSGLSAALHGNTVEKMLDKLKCDVLSMP